MNKKTINEAAKVHAKQQLGDEQFSKNKNAVKAISEDFKAGVEWLQKEFDSVEQLTERNMNTVAYFIEHLKQNGIKVPKKHFLSFFNA